MVPLLSAAQLTTPAALPVAAPFDVLLPDGLVRGRVLSCDGDAALTIALGVLGAATHDGSWLAVVGVPDLGIAAARDAGVALNRLVFVSTPRDTRRWAATMATVIEGFDLVLAAVPDGVAAADTRRLRSRLQVRRGVLVTLGAWIDPADVSCSTTTTRWNGAQHGAGHLRERHVRVRVAGRRVPVGSTHDLVVT